MSRPKPKNATSSDATQLAQTHPIAPVLRSLEIAFTTVPDRPDIVRIDRSCKNGNFNILCFHGAGGSHIGLVVIYPIKSLAPTQFETLRLLNDLNDGLPGGGFRLDFSDGEITFRHCLHLGKKALDPEIVDSALSMICYAVDLALPKIAAVALGQCTYAEVLARHNREGGSN
jgi:hypothetical protein